MFIDGLRLLVSDETSMKVVGYANDGLTACAEIAVLKPDVALIDYRMPGINGLDLIFKLSRLVPETRCVILSMFASKRYIRDAMNGGAVGYLDKAVGKAELMQCLSTVLNGGTYFPKLPASPAGGDKQLFTHRELEIVKLIIGGHTTAHIAGQLSISTHTVETHRKNICRKTNTNTPLALKDFIDDNHIEL